MLPVYGPLPGHWLCSGVRWEPSNPGQGLRDERPRECWAHDPRERPTFAEVVPRLHALLAAVSSS